MYEEQKREAQERNERLIRSLRATGERKGNAPHAIVLESYATECSSRDYYASVLPANVYVCSNWRGCSS
jgi:hypothetical protein